MSVFTASAGIISKTEDCLGNSTSFNYTTASGQSISTVLWNFGDGYTATTTQAVHVYKKTGTFKVTISVTLANGNTETDDLAITIYALPVAAFAYQLSSDTCYYSNRICFKDNSTPAQTGQDIIKRIFLWDDGSSNISNAPQSGDVLCHRYTSPGKYKATMEVTDIYGCKSITNHYYKVVEDTKADFSFSFSFKDCYNAELCFRNKSTVMSPATADYIWKIDTTAIDYNDNFSPPKCIPYNSSKTVVAQLISKASTGCRDSVTRNINISIPPMPTGLSMSSTSICYGDNNPIDVYFSTIIADLAEFSIDNKVFTSTSNITTLKILPKALGILPGKHELKCKIKRGNCTVELKCNFTLWGPIAQMKLVNQYQCSTMNQILAYDSSLYVDSLNTSYYWYASDPGGNKCTTDYNKDKNLYSNCKYAWGKYFKYSFSQLGQFNITHIVKDNKTGCIDSVSMPVDLLRCNKLFQQNNYTICQSHLFHSSAGASDDPLKFSLDSGKTWKRYPSVIDTPYLGTYDVLLIFQKKIFPWYSHYGSDSMQVHFDTLSYFDTIMKPGFLTVLANKWDSVYFKDAVFCNEYTSTVFFKNKLFYPGEKLEIFWGDNTNFIKTFNVLTSVDSVIHLYKKSIRGAITVNLYNKNGCFTRTQHVIGFGKSIGLKVPPPLCINSTGCATIDIFDNKSGKKWTDLNKRSIQWTIADSLLPLNDFKVCYRFNKKGNIPIKAIVTDSNNCTDTVKGTVFIQAAEAIIGNVPPVLYCSELRQFFNYSKCIKTANDSISYYRWDFGDNKFLTTLKDPYKAFNSSGDSVTIVLAVRTVSGCTDTSRVKIPLVGAKPYFTIKDTIACGRMEAVFYNLSGKCKSYIWEFGDSANSTKVLSDTQTVTFTYNKPGRYHIKLYGADTITNPTTMNTYHCVSLFPEYPVVRDVVILPVVSAGILSKDTICMGDTITFKSKDTTYVKEEYWSMGDGAGYIKNPPAPVKHPYPIPGVYTVKLQPKVNFNAAKVCVDSASKNILVMGIQADFSIDKSNKPYYSFTNLSQPVDAGLWWDFDHPESGSLNNSTDGNPTHFYGYKNKTYNICLTATSRFGCKDSVCKPIYHRSDSAFIKLFNVFTPGSEDGKNDYYDILIDGEDFYDLYIYDRWGVLVFHGKADADDNPADNWNGRVFNTGALCPDGTYYYVFHYRIPLFSPEKKTVGGVIQLIR